MQCCSDAYVNYHKTVTDLPVAACYLLRSDEEGRGAQPRMQRMPQEPLSSDLAGALNAATSADNPRHPAKLVITYCIFYDLLMCERTHAPLC